MIDVVLTPAEIALLPSQQISSDTLTTIYVVFDVLRATSTILTALTLGKASKVYPVSTIEEAHTFKKKLGADALLCGERGGIKIEGFDLGNSPHDFKDPKFLKGRTLVTTTTNGTVAIQACLKTNPAQVLIGSLLNISALASYIKQSQYQRLVLVCAGTEATFALEDGLGAGALIEALGYKISDEQLSDSARLVLEVYRLHKSDLLKALLYCENGRRLVRNQLGSDVPWCAQLNYFSSVAMTSADHSIILF